MDDFEEHVILELLLFASIPRADTNPTAHRLISRFGSLAGVLAAPEEELCQVKGVGAVTARTIKNVYGRMLFRMLDGYSVSEGDERLALAAQWHMRNLPDGAVSVFGTEVVIDYVSDDGKAEGLDGVIRRDMTEAGAVGYAFVIRCDEVPDGLRTELARHHFPSVYKLTGYTLEKI